MAGKPPNVIPNVKSPVERGLNPLTGRSLSTGEKVGTGQIESDAEALKRLTVRQMEGLVEKREMIAASSRAMSQAKIDEAKAKLRKAIRQMAGATVDEIQSAPPVESESQPVESRRRRRSED